MYALINLTLIIILFRHSYCLLFLNQLQTQIIYFTLNCYKLLYNLMLIGTNAVQLESVVIRFCYVLIVFAMFSLFQIQIRW